MRNAEFKEDLESITLPDLDRTFAQYRRKGIIHLSISILCWLLAVVSAYIAIILIISTPELEGDRLIGWLIVVAGAFIFVNAVFDLARNFYFSAMLEYRRAAISKAGEQDNAEGRIQ